MSVAPHFGLDDDHARTDAAAVARVVARWRKSAAHHGLSPDEIARMASAFDHVDLETALAFRR
jgi:hypothetical protein